MRIRLAFMLGSIALVAVLLNDMRAARVARFSITNHSGRKLEVKVVGLRDHTKKNYTPVWVENGMTTEIVIMAQAHDLTAIHCRDKDGSILRYGVDHDQFPYGKTERIVVTPDMLLKDEAWASSQELDNKEVGNNPTTPPKNQ